MTTTQALMAAIAEQDPRRVHRDVHGRLHLREDAGVYCRGRSVLEAADVKRLLEAQHLEYRKGMEDRVLDFVGSDETVDRAGDIIRVDGWQLDEFKRNPIILENHDYLGLAVGQALEVKAEKQDGKPVLRFSILFADAETYPRADHVFRLYAGGYMRATSVGFIPLGEEEVDDAKRAELGMPPHGRVFNRQTLLELSMVTVPANPNAVREAYAAKALTAQEALPIVCASLAYDDDEQLLDLFTELRATLVKAVSLNRPGVSRAKALISGGHVDQTSDWSFSAADGNKLLGSSDSPDWARYGKHHLGIDMEAAEETRARYKYPFAKFVDGEIVLFRSALRAIRSRAAQQNEDAIFNAAGNLLEQLGAPEGSGLPTDKVTNKAGESVPDRDLCDRLADAEVELETLRDSLAALEDRLERTLSGAVAPPAPEPEKDEGQIYDLLLGMQASLKGGDTKHQNET